MYMYTLTQLIGYNYLFASYCIAEGVRVGQVLIQQIFYSANSHMQ